MSNYRLTTTDIRQLLADPDFYVTCSAFSFLAPRGLAASALWLKCLRTRGTPEYPGLKEEQIANQELQLITNSFMKHIRVLKEMSPPLLDPLKRYLSEYLAVPPDLVHVAYKENGENIIIEF